MTFPFRYELHTPQCGQHNDDHTTKLLAEELFFSVGYSTGK